MKKLFVMILAALTLFSCQKKESESVSTTQEVVFAAEWVDPGNLKSTNDDPPPAFPCSNLSADYAWVILNGQSYYPDLYELSGQMYTQAIKIDVPSGGQQPIQISQFWLMHDNGNNGYGPEDIPVMGTPMTTSEYNAYVNTPLSFTYTVNAFAKAEIPIQVLCVQQQNIEGFGFDWFGVSEIVVREMCFFGDICLNGDPYKPVDFSGAIYGTDLGVDVPAIMQIRVEQNGQPVPYSPFTNISWKGIGEPLCIQYPDNLEIDDELTRLFLDVLVLDDQGNMVYLNYAQFTIIDDGPLLYNNQPIAGVDNVLDFVIGTCSYEDADIEFDWIQPAPTAKLGLAGEFNHWGGNGADWFLTQDNSNPNLWTATITLDAGDDWYGGVGDNVDFDNLDGIIYMKFRRNQQWLINWGDNTFSSGIGYQDGPNIPVPLGVGNSDITYDVTFNSATGDYNFTEVVVP
ncbi:MAG TPA: hypothetical protein VIN10_04540 [Bacteroidales bacterium]